MKGYHGPVWTDLGMALVDGDGPPTERDFVEIESFQRYLKIAGPAPGGDDEEVGWLRRRAAGWIPYVLGVGPAPPEGMDGLPFTAWTMPG